MSLNSLGWIFTYEHPSGVRGIGMTIILCLIEKPGDQTNKATLAFFFRTQILVFWFFKLFPLYYYDMCSFINVSIFLSIKLNCNNKQ